MKLGPQHTAVITGGARGIGFALASALARRGCRLALLDIDDDALTAAVVQLRTFGVVVSEHPGDITDAAQAAAAADVVLREHGGVHVLVNNAGVSANSRFEDTAPEDFQWLMGVNFWGALHATRAFLPHLRVQPEAVIANVLSGFAFAGFPGKSAYCASKAALRAFSESLRLELAASAVRVLEVYPPAVDTNLVRGGRAAPELRDAEAAFVRDRGMPVDKVARCIVRAIERGQNRVLIGAEPRALYAASRIAPGLFQRALARFQHRIPFVPPPR